jgi:uncharacterized protein (DUF302 family)
MRKTLRSFIWAGVILTLPNLAAGFEYDYTVSTPKSVDEALEAVKSVAQTDGFKIPGVHTLPAGFDYVLVEVCDPAEAKRVLNIEPKLGLLLPCGKLAVYADPKDGNRTKISLLLPSAMVRVYPSQEVWEMAEGLRPKLFKIVEEAK